MAGSALSHSHPQGWLTHTPANRAGSTVLPQQEPGPALLSVATGERGQLSRAPQLVEDRVSSVQPLDIHVVHGSCQTRNIPIFPSGNMSCGHQYRPLLLHSHRTQTWTSAAAWLAGLTSYTRLLLSTLKSLVPSLFIMPKLLHFYYFLICPSHTLTLCWLPLKAGHLAVGTLGDILHPSRCPCAGGRSVDGVAVRRSLCLPSPLPYRMVVGGALCVCGPPVLWVGGQVCGRLSPPAPHRMVKLSSVFLPPPMPQ